MDCFHTSPISRSVCGYYSDFSLFCTWVLWVSRAHLSCAIDNLKNTLTDKVWTPGLFIFVKTFPPTEVTLSKINRVIKYAAYIATGVWHCRLKTFCELCQGGLFLSSAWWTVSNGQHSCSSNVNENTGYNYPHFSVLKLQNAFSLTWLLNTQWRADKQVSWL